MQKIYAVIIGLLICSNILAQENEASGVIIASDFHVTRPIREIFAENPVDEDKISKVVKESEDRKHRKGQTFKFSVTDGPQYGNAENTVQRFMGTVAPLPLRANWVGQSASGFRPYDPSGAVGPNHYVQMINSTTFKVYDKTSGTVLLTGTLGNLWSPATPNAGDPIVMYDKPANRWFLAQFGSGNQIYIAVSQSADPTGAYYTYTYVSPVFPDYLKFSVWTDGYYMTSNQSPQKVFAFNRAEMLAGTPGARSIYTTYSPPTAGFFCPLPGDAADGILPPIGTPCPIFSFSDNAWGAGIIDGVNIYNMAVNWVPTTPTATITLAANVPTAAFDASYEVPWNNCVQPGTTQKLDAIGGVCMYRAQWKNWSGYNTIVLNWSIKISSTQRSIKWVELRQNQSNGLWSLYQEGIYTPDASTRWMGSILMDNNGSIGLSYIKSDATSIFPGLYYTGRRTCDPLGTMPVTEVQVVAGTGSQTSGNRVGDYSHSTLDMDGVTIWNTSEFMGGTTGSTAARTRIFSYQIMPCGNTASLSIAQTSGTTPLCAGSSATFTASPVNGGTTPSYQWKVNGANVGTNNVTFTSSTLTNGQIVTCVMTSNLAGVLGSPANSNAITMVVNNNVTPTISITQTVGTNPICAGATATFTAASTNGGTPSYQWKVNGTNVGTNSATYSTTTLSTGQIVTCMLTSTATCANPTTATSNGITMTVNPIVVPSLSIAISSGTNPSCIGSSLTFTAASVNSGIPSYQWKVNGANVGTNSSTFTSSILTNGQIVTCVITSSVACASPTTVNSNTITLVRNSLPLVTASNVSGCSGNPISLIGNPAGGIFSVTNPYTGPSINYTYTFTDVNGCSSTSNTASIIVNNSSVNTPQNVSVCNSYLWAVNGVTYTNSGTKIATFVNAAGCDSSRILNLIILNNSSSSANVTSVASYTWLANGLTYTNSGIYMHTLINVTGCDSLLTLNLTITISLGVSISPKVILAGPYNSALGLMHDSLRVNGLIPSQEPYSLPPLNMPQIGYVGGETVSSSILAITGNDAIVDWIYLELRSAANSSIIVATKRALLQRDGDVVSSIDGSSPISFSIQAAGDYYVSIKHRNHLGVMTATAISLNNIPTSIDFSSSNPVWTNPLIANVPRKVEGSLRLLHSGDANKNKNVKYNGVSNDKDQILNIVGAGTPNNMISAYRTEDVNLDAKVKYNNTDNDRAAILNSVGANTPNTILFQHTPN